MYTEGWPYQQGNITSYDWKRNIMWFCSIVCWVLFSIRHLTGGVHRSTSLVTDEVNCSWNQNEQCSDPAKVREAQPHLCQSPQQGETGCLENFSSLSLQVPATYTPLPQCVLLFSIWVSLLVAVLDHWLMLISIRAEAARLRRASTAKVPRIKKRNIYARRHSYDGASTITLREPCTEVRILSP